MAIIIGLTGGIGSGKTTVSKLFHELGVPVLDCDLIAHQLVAAGQPALEKIIEHFGTSVLETDGTLNRRAIREIIFKDHSERKWLQDLLHPLILSTIREQVKETRAPYVIVVVPLLIEVEAYDLVQRVLVVDSPEELQIQRTMLRDNCSEKHVRRIINTQATRQQRLLKADDVIVNDGNLSSLKRQVEKLHHYYQTLV